MVRIFFYALLLFSVMSTAQCQTLKNNEGMDKKYTDKYQEAQKEARKGNYNESVKLYHEVLKKYPQKVEAWLKLASVQYNQKDYTGSISNFKKAIAIDPEYNPEMYFSLALVYRENKMYGDASDAFQLFLDREKTHSDRISKALDYKLITDFRDSLMRNPVDFVPEKLSDQINTSYSEYLPSITLDGQMLIFTRRLFGQEDLFYSRIIDGQFAEAEPLSELNTAQNEGAHCISADGKTLIFTACDRRDSYGGCDLYYALFEKGKWTTPFNMGRKVNTPAYEAQPSLSSDGKTLYFVSNRTGSVGGKDIWMTWRDEKNQWANPVNAGSVINTLGNDESPFIHPDGLTLYFRSDGRIGMGGFDIYYSRWSENDQRWNTPANIGFPINTEGSEGALMVSLDGETAYFSSDMAYAANDRNANLDIYRFKLHVNARPVPTTYVRGKVTDAHSGLALQSMISIIDLRTDKEIYRTISDMEGIFMTGLAVGKNYACIVEKNGYTFYSANFELTDLVNPENAFFLDVKLNPIIQSDNLAPESAPTILHNIFFDSGSSTLLPESTTEISKLKEMMISQPSIRLKIVGHTDNIGNESDNQLLSENRAKAVYNALIREGVVASRLFFEGKGESMPIDDNATEAGRKNNRRTEFVVIRT